MAMVYLLCLIGVARELVSLWQAVVMESFQHSISTCWTIFYSFSFYILHDLLVTAVFDSRRLFHSQAGSSAAHASGVSLLPMRRPAPGFWMEAGSF